MANAQNPPPRPPTVGEGTAPIILLVGTLAGMVLIAVGVYFTVAWWGTVTGGLEEWHKHWWQLLVCELLVFGGLAVMFGALQVARSEERTNPGMRRLIYGYNAVLTSLLVLTILVHLNVFTYFPVAPFTWAQQTYDWTDTNYYSLSPGSKELLQRLDKPVKVYILLPSAEEYTLRQLRTLIDNCRAVNRHIEVEELSPDLSPQAVAKLEEKYQLPERQGLLVVYGPEGDEKSEFVPVSDFAPRRAGGMTRPGEAEKPEKIEFKGESALMGALSFLLEGKAQPVIYFTQGNGELELNNSFDTARDDRGLGLLRDRLTRAKFDVKELKLGAANDKVPDDADVVVIARPSREFPQPALDALQAYLHPTDPKAKKGKLIVLFDVVKTPEGEMVHTGLEELLLKDFGVQVDNNRVVCLGSRRDPTDVPVGATEHPIVSRFEEGRFLLHDVRTVHQAERNPAGPPPAATVEPILLADQQFGIWKETNLNVDVAAEVQSLLKPDRRQELFKKLSHEDLPVAVAVSELGGPSGDPNDPHAFMHRQQQPRLVVFGDATWVANRRMGEGGYIDLFTSSLGWLRDRPVLGATSESKERKAYLLQPKDLGQFVAQVFWIPMALLTVGIIGLGTGVWVVRRR
jgi:hypothetical protein